MYEEACSQIEELIADGEYLQAANLLQRVYLHRYRELAPAREIRDEDLVFDFNPQSPLLLRLKAALFLHRIGDALDREDFRRAYRYFDSLVAMPLPHELDPDLHFRLILQAEKLYRGADDVRLLEFIGAWGHGSLCAILAGCDAYPDRRGAARVVLSCLHAAVKRRVLQEGIEVDWLVPLGREVAFSTPVDVNTLRAYGRFLIAQERLNEALPIYQYLYPHFRETFHFWADLAYCFPGEPTVQIGLLFIALSRPADEKYLGQTRKRLADLLYQEGYGEAAAEQIGHMLANRAKYQYHISVHTRRKYERLAADFPASEGSSLAIAEGFMREAEDVIRRGMEPEAWTVSRAPCRHTHGTMLEVEKDGGDALTFCCDGMPDLLGAVGGMVVSLYLARLGEGLPPSVVYGEHPRRGEG